MHAIIITWLLARYLVRILREFASYYNFDRPHRSLDLSPPIRPSVTAPTLRGAIVSRPVLWRSPPPRLLESHMISMRLLPSYTHESISDQTRIA
jgi:hypothetical protein